MDENQLSAILGETQPARETMRLTENHKSYVLRLWCDSTTPHWHATLMDVRAPHDSHHFADLNNLVTFLLEMRFIGGTSSA